MMIFEDSSDVPISKLLKSVLGSEVDFAEGVNGLEKLAKYYSPISSMVVVFVDCVYDNPRLLGKYVTLTHNLYHLSNVYIVKIPCIEFFAIKFLLKEGILKDSFKLVSLFKQSLLQRINHGYPTYEKFCKSVLNSYPLMCLHNKDEGDLKLSGKYWLKDCKFNSICGKLQSSGKCQRGIHLILSEKSEFFLYELPCLCIDSCLSGFSEVNEIDVENTIKQLNSKYSLITQ